MKIIYDYKAFCGSPYSGVSRYYVEIIKNLITESVDIAVLAPFHRNKLVTPINNSLTGFYLTGYPPKTTKIFLTLNHIISSLLVKAKDYNILHETYYSNFPIDNSKIKVLTVYDCTHELLGISNKDPALLSKINSINRADHIICISNNTKSDLINFYNIPEEKISVTHCGVTESTVYSSINHKSDFCPVKPFILYVGTRFEYKGFYTLIDALAIDNHILNEFNIVFFAGGYFSSVERDYILKRNLDISKFICISGDDNLLAYLYANAELLVYPSKYEGFGFPPVDAMRNRCPVIVSQSSCLPEVAGNGAVYFEPDQPESLLFAMKSIIFDQAFKEKMAQLGYDRSLRYTWKSCAMETKATYHALL